MTTENHKLSVSEKFGYGLGDLASNMFWQMFAIFMAKFYTDVFLLGAATMGTMMLVTRVADAFFDPMIGTIADRTETRWGHFRPYLIWMAIPMAATAVLAFTVPDLDGTARTVYAYVTLMLMMFAYSAINIPYSALLGVLTPDSKERTSVTSYRFVMALIPVFIIVNTALPLVRYFGGSDTSPYGWQMTMLIYSVIAVLLYFATFAMTRERVQPPPKQETSLKTDLKDLVRNRPWVVLCGVGIAALTFGNIRNTVTIYYFENVVPNGGGYFGPVMTTGAIAFILGVMATSPLAKRFGKRNFYLVSMSVTALLTFGFYFVPPENIKLVWAANTLINFCAAPTAPLVWAMYADTADYSEWKWGRRATGLVFSAASFAQKFGWAIGGAGAGWLLAYFGYLPNVAQSPRTIHGIVLMMSMIPAIAAIAAVAALWFYEIDEETVKQHVGRSRGAARIRAGRGCRARRRRCCHRSSRHSRSPSTRRWRSAVPRRTRRRPNRQRLPAGLRLPRRGFRRWRRPMRVVPRRCRRRSHPRNSPTWPASSRRRCTQACTDCVSARTSRASRPVRWWTRPRYARALASSGRTRAGCAASPARTGTNGRRASRTSSA